MSPSSHTWIVCLWALVGCSRHSAPQRPGEDEQLAVSDPEILSPLLQLGANVTDHTALVSVHYALGTKTQGARLAEIMLGYEEAFYTSYRKGEVLDLAEKQLVVQQVCEAKLRTVVFTSSNVNRLASGPLATYEFALTPGVPATFEILTDNQIFAPLEANEGLIVGDPITVVAE